MRNCMKSHCIMVKCVRFRMPTSTPISCQQRFQSCLKEKVSQFFSGEYSSMSRAACWCMEHRNMHHKKNQLKWGKCTCLRVAPTTGKRVASVPPSDHSTLTFEIHVYASIYSLSQSFRPTQNSKQRSASSTTIVPHSCVNH